MFTGIIETTGTIVKARITPANMQLTIQAPSLWLGEIAIGDSIAVNGVCLTVVEKDTENFVVDVSNETQRLTTGLQKANEVNLEKALRFGDRLDGHLVSGHVDAAGKVIAMEDLGASWRLAIEAPQELAKFIARKGSIAVNGISLTINTVQDLPSGAVIFEINIIPHTYQLTTIHRLVRGGEVNLEIDLLARYIERYITFMH